MRSSARNVLLRAFHRAFQLVAAGRSGAIVIAVAVARCPLVLAGAGQAAAGTRVSAGADAAGPGGSWHTAVQVPGTAGLNQDGGNPGNADAGVTSVSCSRATRCTVLGGYTDRSGYEQAFVASES